MTKQELEAENKRLRKALLEIVHDTSNEEIERERKRKQERPYAYTVGRVSASALYALYGEDYLFSTDKGGYKAKAREELAEYDK